jgi:amino acid transporter
LQLVMIGALDPAHIVKGWSMPLGSDPSNYGVWYTLALTLGAGWLAKALLLDAVISPAGTGVVYLATTARLSYALGEAPEMPAALATTKNGVPVVSILTAAVVGSAALGPFKSWNALVSVVTEATAIMYAFAPVALASLHKIGSDRQPSYRVPLPKLVLPAAFCSANLIIYWGGFDTNWKLGIAMLAGLALFAIGARRGRTGAVRTIRHAVWVGPWLGGHVLLGWLGRYGGGRNILPNWVDVGVVIVFALAIFHWATALRVSKEASALEVGKDAEQIYLAPT